MMAIGIQPDYTGSPLMSGGASQYTLFDTPGVTGSPVATPSGGISGVGLGLEQPGVGDFDIGSTGTPGAGLDVAGAAIGGALDVGATVVQGVLSNQQQEDQRRLARELADMRRADEWATIARQERQRQAGMGIAREGQKLQSKENSLEARHNRFMRAFQRQMDRDTQARGLMENVGSMVTRDANMRRRLIQGWART